jgi:hypothetical protein
MGCSYTTGSSVRVLPGWRRDGSRCGTVRTAATAQTMKAPGDARVPRLAALLASLRCLRRRGSPNAPAPFSPTRSRSLRDRYHYRRETTRAFLTHGLDRLQLRNGTATGVSSCRADARFARSRRASAHACRAHEIPRRPIRAVGEPRGASPAQPHPGLPAPRTALGPGVRFATPVRHPTQSSSLLLGARPDPHPVVGVRIGPSGSVASFTDLCTALTSLRSAGGGARSVHDGRVRRAVEDSLTPLSPHCPSGDSVAPPGFPTALSRRLDYSDAT